MSEDTTWHDDGLIDVSEFTLRQLANEVDESILTRALRRLLDSREADGGRSPDGKHIFDTIRVI